MPLGCRRDRVSASEVSPPAHRAAALAQRDASAEEYRA